MASYHAWRYNLLKSADRKLHLVSYRTTLSAKQGENMAVLNTHITALENQLLCASLLTVGAIVSLEERDPAATKSEARIAQEARLLLTDLYHWFSQLGKSFLYAPETVNLAIPYCLESLVRLGVVEKQGEGEEATYRLAPPSRHHPAVAIPLPDGVYA
ncbi:MAG: hypothetical protein D6736_08980 [Nitrospinota bacterium]|nr:MAG: hypothetical protein D6736_08980 [Nitrospinota bacterium]